MKAAALLLFALLSLASATTNYFIGANDTSPNDWEEPTNWDSGIVPHDFTWDVYINAGKTVFLPANANVSGIYASTGANITVLEDALVDVTIQLSSATIDIRADLSGMGQITGGSVVIRDSWVDPEIRNSDIDFQGARAYATKVVLTTSGFLITGTNWDTPSVESFAMTTLGDSVHVYNMTVVDLMWTGGDLYYNLKVTGTAHLSYSNHNVYNMFYVVNHTLDHTWDYGYIYTYTDSDIYMAGSWNCSNPSSSTACYWNSYLGDGKVKLEGSFWSDDSVTLSGQSGIYEVNANFVGQSSIDVTSLTGSANFYGALTARGMITLDTSSVTGDAIFSGTIDLKDVTFGGYVVFSAGSAVFRDGLVFSNALVNFNGNTLDILGALAIDNFRFDYTYSSVLNIKADVVIQNFTSYGIINLWKNITIFNWDLYYSYTYVHGDYWIFVNDTFDSHSNTLELHNTTLVFYPDVEATANSMYLYGDATFRNYGHVTFLRTTFKLDTDAAVVNVGTFTVTSGYSFSFDEMTSGETGGEFVNVGILSNGAGGATFDFNNGIPFYQCKSGSLDLTFDSTPTLLLSTDAVVNGKINVFFSTQNGYDSVSSSYGTQYGYWDTRKGALFSLPLNGLASTYTIIAGGSPSYSKGTSCQDTSSSTTTYMTYWKSKDINIFKCKSFDPISIPDNDWCNLIKQPLFNGSSKTTFSLAALAVLAVFMLFF